MSRPPTQVKKWSLTDPTVCGASAPGARERVGWGGPVPWLWRVMGAQHSKHTPLSSPSYYYCVHLFTTLYLSPGSSLLLLFSSSPIFSTQFLFHTFSPRLFPFFLLPCPPPLSPCVCQHLQIVPPPAESSVRSSPPPPPVSPASHGLGNLSSNPGGQHSRLASPVCIISNIICWIYAST